MSKELIEKYGLENYKLGELAYKSYADNLDHLNDGLTGGGISIPDFVDNTDRNQEAWIKASEIIKKTVLESQEQYCFVQDESCHWFLLPSKYKEKFQELDEKGDWEGMEQFSDYRTGGGISDIYFSNPIEIE